MNRSNSSSQNLFKFIAFIVFPLENVSRGFFLPKFKIKSEKFEKNCHKKCLEKVSGNSPGSLPEFTKIQISFQIIDFGKCFRKIP